MQRTASQAKKISRASAERKKRAAAAAPPPVAKREAWKQSAIDSCKKGGLRKNCESDEYLKNHAPVPELKRQQRRERRRELGY